MELTSDDFLRGCCYLTATTLISSVIPLTRIFQLRLRLLFFFSEKYVLVKKAQLWAAEAHEYVFFVRTGHLDEETFRTYNDALLEEGLSRVEPKKDHMYTYVSVVFLAESIAPEVPKLIKKTRCHRDYRMSLYGWMDYRIAAYDCTSKRIYTNWAGRPLKQTLLSVTKKRRKHK